MDTAHKYEERHKKIIQKFIDDTVELTGKEHAAACLYGACSVIFTSMALKDFINGKEVSIRYLDYLAHGLAKDALAGVKELQAAINVTEKEKNTPN